MSRLLPLAWSGFGCLATIGAIHDPRILFAAILIGLAAALGEVYRDVTP